MAQLLWQQTLLLALATAFTLLLHPLALRYLGARAAYLLWLGVPAACLGGCWPRLGLWSAMQIWPSAARWQPVSPTALTDVAAISAGANVGPWLLFVLLGLWLLGAVLLGWRIVWQHRRMLRSLLPATALPASSGGGAFASALRAPAGCGPLLIGLWRPRLCLPADFETRFDAAEQAAIVQHEDMHRRRHDNAWNLLGSGLLLLHWFNPLAWWALRRMRADQELSCDAAVLSQNTAPSDAVYTQALLKSQGLFPGLSPSARMRCTDTGSAWLSVHPLLERVSMLKQHRALAPRRRIATVLATTTALLLAGLGQAVQGTPQNTPPDALAADINTVMLTMDLQVDGQTVAKTRLFGALGAPMVVRWQADDALASSAWEIEVTTTVANTTGQLMFSGKFSTGEPLRVVSQPRLVAGEGQSASVQIGADGGRPSLKLTLKGQRMAQPERAAAPTSKPTSLALPPARR
jgi:beta-lactamase regulating signal transducer with metallopeptidase domain